jgi:hypothetical protein
MQRNEQECNEMDKQQRVESPAVQEVVMRATAAELVIVRKERDALRGILAELVAWDGEEDNFSYAKRILRAKRLLNRTAPDVLAAEKAKVPAE